MRGSTPMPPERNVCRWYNATSGIKRAFDAGLIERRWVEEYCLKGGEGCVRKRRFEEEGRVSPDYVLPDGSESEAIKRSLI
ncbi:MAG: hypothetical protein ACOCX2_01455 [Armatimonadota bacterium]